jgi:adenylate kinase
METYRQQTKPLTEYYQQRQLLETVEAMGTVDEVFSSLLAALKRLRQR